MPPGAKMRLLGGVEVDIVLLVVELLYRAMRGRGLSVVRRIEVARRLL